MKQINLGEIFTKYEPPIQGFVKLAVTQNPSLEDFMATQSPELVEILKAAGQQLRDGKTPEAAPKPENKKSFGM